VDWNNEGQDAGREQLLDGGMEERNDAGQPESAPMDGSVTEDSGERDASTMSDAASDAAPAPPEPVLTVDFPPPGVVDGPSIRARGTVTAGSEPVTLHLNDMPVQIEPGGIWSATLELRPGANEFHFEAATMVGSSKRDLKLVRELVVTAPSDLAVAVSNWKAYLMDATIPALYSVDLSTAVTTLLAAPGVGSGVDLGSPISIGARLTFDGPGLRPYYTPYYTARYGEPAQVGVLRLETTGNRAVVSSGSVGSGPALSFPSALAFDQLRDRFLYADGQVRAVSPATGARSEVAALPCRAITVNHNVAYCLEGNFENFVVTKIDLETNQTAVVSDGRARPTPTAPGANAGPTFIMARGIASSDMTRSIYVSDEDRAAIIEVNPETGARTILSGRERGVGPALVSPEGIGVDADGNVLVADPELGALVRVNFQTGDRSLVMRTGAGAGPYLTWPRLIGGDGEHLWALDTNNEAIVAIDRTSGARELLGALPTDLGGNRATAAIMQGDHAGAYVLKPRSPAPLIRISFPSGQVLPVASSDRGTGPGFNYPQALAWEELDRKLLVLDGATLLRVDVNTGDRTELSGPNVGHGPAFVGPSAVIMLTAETTFVSDLGGGTQPLLFKVDLRTGDREAVISPDNLQGLKTISGLGADPAGKRLFVFAPNRVFALDIQSGELTSIVDTSQAPGLRLALPRQPYYNGVVHYDGGRRQILLASAHGIIAIDETNGNRMLTSR
jgi:hypothetical protein